MSSNVSKLTFDEFIIQIYSHDVRTPSGVNEIQGIFKTNTNLLLSNKPLEELLYKFHMVKACVEDLVEKSDRYINKYASADVSLCNKFIIFLTGIPLNTVNDNSIKDKLPVCDCNDNKNSDHLLRCDKIATARNEIIIKEIKEKSGIFKEKVIEYSNACLSYAGVQLGNAFRDCRSELRAINQSAEGFYSCLAKALKDKSSYTSFTPEQSVTFHQCMVEILSFRDISSFDIITERQTYLGNSKDKLGLYYYLRLNNSLKMTGWYYPSWLDDFSNALRLVADEQKTLTNKVSEKQIFKTYFMEILVRNIKDVTQKKEILYYLKKISKYILLSKYRELMFVYYQDHNMKDKYTWFYGKLKEVSEFTEKNCFKN